MTDDIVARLRDITCGSERWCGNDPNCRPCDAIDEIERLRELLANQQKQIDGIRNALTDEGTNPAWHHLMIRRLQRDWPVLWRAIDKATKEPAQPLLKGGKQ